MTDKLPTVTGHELDMHRARKLQERLSRGPAEDARLVEALRAKIAKIAQVEFDESHTEAGHVAHSDFLGDRIASAVLASFHVVRVHRFTKHNGVIWPSPIKGMPVSGQVVLETAPEVLP